MINYLMTMWSTDATTLSLQSHAHFVDLMVDLIFKKLEKHFNFYDFYVKSNSHYSLVHILSTTFWIEARARRNRHPPTATTDSHFTGKKKT